jgi:hypothetical protein
VALPEIRRRYLEHEATERGGLERAAARIYWAKAGIEEMLDEAQDPEERAGSVEVGSPPENRCNSLVDSGEE